MKSMGGKLRMIIFALLISGCAPTSYPFLIPMDVATKGDELGRKIATGVFSRNKESLEALGISSKDASLALQELPASVPASARPHFVFDSIVGDEYCRQYRPDDRKDCEVRIWFHQYGDRPLAADGVDILLPHGAQ